MNDNENKKLKPSEEQVWLKHYAKGAYDASCNIPKNKILWDIIEEKIFEFENIPAIEYFRNQMSRPEYRELVYSWATKFKVMGVEPGEIVPIYAPFVPGISAILMALNIVGACPNLLKLGMTKDIYKDETEDSKVAVVFDSLYNNELYELFKDDRFKKVIVASASDYMLAPQKQIVTAMTKFKALKSRTSIPKDSKYIWYDDCMKYSDVFTNEVRADFVADRPAFITYSSGTTAGIPKGAIATNETAISKLLQSKYADVDYKPGGSCFTNLPPTASTSLHCLFLLAIYNGLTVNFNPIFSSQKYYSQLMEAKPSVAAATGSFWVDFYREYKKAKKKPSLDFFDMAIIGGEGVTPEEYNELKSIFGNKLYSGYGLSEDFSVISNEKKNTIYPNKKNDMPVISVGIPFPGVKVGIFDDNGNELDYNQRGELYVSSKSRMLGYYKNEELTNNSFKDEWFKTGDIFSLDEDGQLYMYGRKNNSIESSSGRLYLFDIAYRIKQLSNGSIRQCLVNSIDINNKENALVAHIVFDEKAKADYKQIISNISAVISDVLPSDVEIVGYKIHDKFNSSPTTGKIDYIGIKNDMNNYIIPNSLGEIQSINFIKNVNTDKYDIECNEIKEKNR